MNVSNSEGFFKGNLLDNLGLMFVYCLYHRDFLDLKALESSQEVVK